MNDSGCAIRQEMPAGNDSCKISGFFDSARFRENFDKTSSSRSILDFSMDSWRTQPPLSQEVLTWD